jgi:hypothetical protein
VSSQAVAEGTAAVEAVTASGNAQVGAPPAAPGPATLPA